MVRAARLLNEGETTKNGAANSIWVGAAPFQCLGGAARRAIRTRRLSGIALLASLGDWLRRAMASTDRITPRRWPAGER